MRTRPANTPRAALQGIAADAAATRRQLHTDPALADEALRIIEDHARAALAEPTAAALPVRIPVATPSVAAVITARAVTVERAVELLQDPPGNVGRMRIFELLAMVRDVGPVGARELLSKHRMTEGRSVNSIPFPERVLLAGALRNRTGARL
jgi:hypothetical protein